MENKNYGESLKWVIYGIGVATGFILILATYLIVRIADGNWGDYKLPLILLIVFSSIVPIVAMFLSIGDIKKEIEKNKETK